ncbi:acyl-CoA dehydrogenase [Actinomadura sp. 7K507]|uniref:acyl-CoA dehydrogenase n=1 Tax=Actinomadura sp. 7K507 TaxID=2530365 RepID=UPI00104ECFD6|nr:acyl-CoA dehydrogenase [Actinomadura sp. 7K507]TDC76228.1 acyl-CoA dehydrogenase [Actinomadura sp. 7K507]
MTTTPAGRAAHLLSRRNLDFMLYEWLDVARLTARSRFREHSAETFSAVLDLSEQLAVRKFAPHNREADRCEPVIGADGRVLLAPPVRDAVHAYTAAGLQAASFDHHYGGMQLPVTLQKASSLWFTAANGSTAGYLFLASAAANLLVAHAGADLVDRYARPLIEGRFFGTMCLSEPDAGSSLADITTRADLRDDGTYRVRGTKTWISAGDHELGENIVHLVLARTGAPESGVKGISLFAVPKFLVEADGSIGERNDVALLGLNHKMGNRGTVNAVLGFGEGDHRPRGEAGAIGHLVGSEGSGLACMFHMMNEARIAVGAAAASLGSTGYLKSLAYAKTRLQGRRAGDGDQSPRVPIIEHADVRRMLLAQKSYVEGSLALVLYCARLVDEQASAPGEAERDRARMMLDVLTPIAKSFPAQWCLAANDLAIQIHGGYGYTRDFDVEQHYRDNRLNQIHEGTHGVQGLDLLGRKVRANGGAAFQILIDGMRKTASSAREQDAEPTALAELLERRIDRLVATSETLSRAADRPAAMANSSLYLEAMGHVVVAWLWLEQVVAAADKADDFYEGKRAAARYFFYYELPRTDHQFDLLCRFDRTTLDLVPECL